MDLSPPPSVLSRPVARIEPSAPGGAAYPAIVAIVRESAIFKTYQRAFETATGLPLVLRAAGSLRTPLQGSKKQNAFCALLTLSNRSCGACLQLQERVEREAVLGPCTFECYAGLVETAVPVRVGGKVVGYLQTGQVFLRTPTPRQFKILADLVIGGAGGAIRSRLETAYFRSRVLPRKQYESVIQLLAVFAEHLAAVSNQMLLRETATEPSAISRGRLFIAAHHREELCLGDVARAVHMSACHFCRVFKRSTGLTFMDYLARERIESVKCMLLKADLRISEAAYAAGFQSLSQFNRVFRRVEGEAPSDYRGRLRGAGSAITVDAA